MLSPCFCYAFAVLCLNGCRLQAGWANCINVSLFPLIAHFVLGFFFFLKPLRRALKRIVIKGGDDNFKSAIESGGGGPPQCQLNKVENARQ